MEIEIRSKEAKPLLKRTEVRARIAFTGATPARREVVAAVAKAAKAQQGLVIVRRIATAYGSQSAGVLAYVYDDKETLERLEHDHMKKKHAAEERKAEEPEKPAEPEAPKEEKAADEQPAEKAEQKDKKQEEKPAAKQDDKASEPKEEKAADEQPAEKPKEEKPAAKEKAEKKGGEE